MKKLSSAEIEQLRAYVVWAEREGTYYGNRRTFDNRHKRIKDYLEHLETKEGAE